MHTFDMTYISLLHAFTQRCFLHSRVRVNSKLFSLKMFVVRTNFIYILIPIKSYLYLNHAVYT